MSLSRSEYRQLTKTALGRELRDIMLQAINDPRDRPSVSQIEEALTEAGVPASHHNDIMIRVRRLAKKRAEGGTDILALRGEADLLTVKSLKELASEDDLLGEAHGFEPDPDHHERAATGKLADAIRNRGTSEPLLDEPIRFDDGTEVRF